MTTTERRSVLHLSDLVSILPDKTLRGPGDVEVTGVKNDSRQVAPGDLFIAVRGVQLDAHKFIPEAISKGAVAVLCEDDSGVRGATAVRVPDSRAALPLVASAFFGHPTKRLRLIGVTGTNGKTTTTNLIRKILMEAGHRAGLLGTISTIVCDQSRPAHLTTPDAIELQALFSEMVDCGSAYGVMEVSSHALALHRVDSCEFDMAVFTNLTQDHLDYHVTMENYRDAKADLFRELGQSYHGNPKTGPKTGIINADDPSAEYMVAACPVRVLTYGIDSDADIRARRVTYESGRCLFTAHTPAGTVSLHLKLAGRINVYNSLAAIACAVVEGIPLEQQKRALEAIAPIPGRFDRVDEGQKFAVIVDYAHSPDGLLNVLKVSRDLARGNVIVVFGCGGDRDRTKRPIMGRIAGENSDLAIVTSDNPRSEDPEAIIDEIEAGIKEASPRLGYVREPDRAQAIRNAIWSAQEGDAVLIAGKGHENYQIFRDKTIHFDDREVASALLRERSGEAPGLFAPRER